MPTISRQDQRNYELLRENVTAFLQRCANQYDTKGRRVLDIAPQVHEGAKAHFHKSIIFTLDIDPQASVDYHADICQNNQKQIPDASFEVVVCTEVLEHVLNPFDAVREIRRLLTPGGVVLITTPFNFRIHGPLPDCWRFTEHGLRTLLAEFAIIELNALETKNRWLMPIHYTTIARRP